MDTTETEAPRAGGGLLLRGTGILLVWVGGTVLLYLVWVLWFTGVDTARAQQELLDQFEGFDTAAPADEPDITGDDPVVADEPTTTEPAVEIGSGIAVLEFERPGGDVPPVSSEPYVVVEGTTLDALTAGPGHYVSTAMPGAEGNFAVAGHRTTWGAPFYDMQQLRPGDLIHATARDGTRHTYEVTEGSSGGGAPGQHIVAPGETWVIGEDPLGTDGAMITLTTCHPRWSAAQRMVVFGQLVESASA